RMGVMQSGADPGSISVAGMRGLPTAAPNRGATRPARKIDVRVVTLKRRSRDINSAHTSPRSIRQNPKNDANGVHLEPAGKHSKGEAIRTNPIQEPRKIRADHRGIRGTYEADCIGLTICAKRAGIYCDPLRRPAPCIG